MAERDTELPTEQDSYLERRDMLLKDIDRDVIRRAWFTLSHLLLDEGAKVVDMGCDDGAMTYAMAAINPKIKFIGLDKSKRQINKAREKYSLHNLDFIIGDSTSEIFEPDSVDAIINSYVLHEVYSGSRYNERIVSDTLRKHFKILKKDGVMFIRDFARPNPGEYVLMEMPDTDSAGDTLATLSEPDLLVWYSEHARPRSDPGTGGFFLEELPPRFPRTRLFRLPHKWAYEFIMRKDNRAHWEQGLPTEYTFFTPRDFVRELSSLGARVQYCGPHWEEEIIEKSFEGHFKLYADDGSLLGHPPTAFVTVAYKMAERKSLYIEERRPSATEKSTLKIHAMRREKDGKIVDIVSRGLHVAEIMPYRVDEDGCLKIFLHDGIVHSIVNAVPRGGINLDGRSWSGHMIEPVAVDHAVISNMDSLDMKTSARFSRDHLGLIPTHGAVLEKGPDYYPSPDYIDEHVYTYYINVERPRGAHIPKNFIGHNQRFHARGLLREMDAQQILNAISVGMIPNARLELQILALFSHLKIRAENWSARDIPFQVAKITKQKSLYKMLKQHGDEQARFRNIKGSAGQLRPVHSTFVEEGQARGAVTGLSAQDVDFVVFDDKTLNTAIVLPLSLSIKGDIHAGFFVEQMPVPHLYSPGASSPTAPIFDLPRNLTNLQQVKKYLADQFGVLPQMVFKIGESYYNHLGITPQKIHPFGVAVPPQFLDDPTMKVMPLYQLILQCMGGRNTHFMTLIARSYRLLGEHIRFEATLRAAPILNERFDQQQPDWSLPMTYRQAPGLKQDNGKPPAPKKTTAPPPAPQKPRAFHAAMLSDPQPDALPEPLPVTAAPLRPPIPAMQIPEAEALVKPVQQTAPLRPEIPAAHVPSSHSAGLMEEFERDLGEILEELGTEEKNSPRPEKW